MDSKNKQIKKSINIVLKIVVSVGSISYLVFLLGIEKASFWKQIHVYFSKSNISLFPLFLVFILMFVNWGAEIIKWHKLANYLMPSSFALATKSTFAGVAASVFTPFRVGSYIGKAAMFPHRYRAKGLILQMFNAMAMFIVNFFFGLLFLGILGGYSKNDIFGMNADLFSVLGYTGAGIVLVFWCLFIKVRILLTIFDRWKLTKNWRKYFDLVNDENYGKLSIQLLLISIIRYLAITSQYVLAYEVFGVGTEPWQTFVASGTLFFIFQFLPVFNALEFGVTRTALLTLIFTTFGIVINVSPSMALSITLASFCIWLINLAIPSILGSVFLSQVKVLKES
jgi:hypothetical protein